MRETEQAHRDGMSKLLSGESGLFGRLGVSYLDEGRWEHGIIDAQCEARMDVTWTRSLKWAEESYAWQPVGGSAKLNVCAGRGSV